MYEGTGEALSLDRVNLTKGVCSIKNILFSFGKFPKLKLRSSPQGQTLGGEWSLPPTIGLLFSGSSPYHFGVGGRKI